SLPRGQALGGARSGRGARAAPDRTLFAGNVERIADRTTNRSGRSKRAARPARPGDDRAFVRQRSAHLQADRRASRKLQSRRRDFARHRQREQNASRAGWPQGVRSARRLFSRGTTETGQTPHGQRNLPFLSRKQTDYRASLADRQKRFAPGRSRKKRLSSFAPA